ncbi:hypothetical protein M408DRAFT_30430 [Serendipita vermifera MAFF 305830]|uniref:Uncharacterized protein n=1 Tax=Serendipita vermifera MAFF 305830 TaxID=933852 RepID=A0A0C3A6S7_SERVB|nr:hypothetical protein M408DRAFT_30430 [Serendipita vermifera MAFF 305830]
MSSSSLDFAPDATIIVMPLHSRLMSGNGNAGGARGISQLKILTELMHSLAFGTNYVQITRTYDVFDVIGSLGTGSFITILLVKEFIDIAGNVLFSGTDIKLDQMEPLLQGGSSAHVSSSEWSIYQWYTIILLIHRGDTPAQQYLNNHIMHMSPFWDQQISNEAIVLDPISISRAYHHSGQSNWVLKLRGEALRPCIRTLAERHVDTIQASGNLADTYSDLGLYTEALILNKEVLRSCNKVLGYRHLRTISATNSLAANYCNLGQLKKVLRLNKEVLKLRKEILGERHPDTISALNNLAVTFYDLGRHSEALVLKEEGLTLRKLILGEHHPETILTSINLANTYSSLGKYHEALVLSEEVLRLRMELMGTRHPETCRARINLAILYRDFGKLSEARGLVNAADAILLETLGAMHPLCQMCRKIKIRLRTAGYWMTAEHFAKRIQ